MNPAARRTTLKLSLTVVGMFGFGFALGPLYNALCKVTGWNGTWNPMVADAAAPVEPDYSRTVKVEFVTTVNGSSGWAFRAEQQSLNVHPGELYTVNFVARNLGEQELVAQAVPNVAPWDAAKHLKKTECFCFNNQPFAPGEEKQMPMRFMLGPDLPRSVDTVTLSYTFFDVTETAANGAGSPQS
jgi:cytochrome c oxidase assembly protein subunit 11